MIALLGNPFSPAYARARALESAPRALSFCAMNVCVYGARERGWALTERRIEDSDRDATSVTIGASSMRRSGDTLRVDLRERTAPFGRALAGTVTFHAEAPPVGRLSLDRAGEHSWWPIAPSGRIEVELDEPRLRFSGRGYHDANAGDGALDERFSRWSWSRAPLARGRTIVTYDVVERGGAQTSYALDLGRDGAARLEGLHDVSLPTTGFRLRRSARADLGASARVLRSLEDTPFYARSLVATELGGERAVAMHEALSGDRLRQRWVRFLLGFRMGRA